MAFLLDDILLAPFKGILFIAEKIQEAAQQGELLDEEATRHNLTTLYMLLETGAITEEEFEQREAELVQKLEEIGGSEGQ
ncbi:MAG: gas vesicle protein GvpG [Ignavibacteriales bacterium]|nr:gas vesicle protein GvpG [Ignavibacteriales bacterium]